MRKFKIILEKHLFIAYIRIKLTYINLLNDVIDLEIIYCLQITIQELTEIHINNLKNIYLRLGANDLIISFQNALC